MTRLLPATLILTILAGTVCAQTGQPASRKSATAKQARPAAAKSARPDPFAAAPYSPPPEAERLADGSYRWTNPAGVVWIYKQSPFGWGRMKETDLPQTRSAAAAVAIPTVSGVEGDKVHFREEGPFGTRTWTRGKNELSESEAAALRRYESGPASAARTGAAVGKDAKADAAKASGKEKN